MNKNIIIGILSALILICAFIAGVAGYIKGVNDGVLEGAGVRSFGENLCNLTDSLLQGCINLVNTYEINCPMVYEGIQNNSIVIVTY